MPKVSFIVPVYNVEKYLRQCLDSMVQQTLTDIEIICVDDCSTDNSLSILREYEAMVMLSIFIYLGVNNYKSAQSFKSDKKQIARLVNVTISSCIVCMGNTVGLGRARICHGNDR